MPRSNWKGFISFGLVSIPVVLYTSENTADKVSFHEIDRRNNARIKFKRVNAENGKEVPWDDIAKGYEYSKDNIFVAGPDELKKSPVKILALSRSNHLSIWMKSNLLMLVKPIILFLINMVTKVMSSCAKH